MNSYKSWASSTYVANGTAFAVKNSFTGGYANGFLSTDTMNIGGMKIKNQTFGEILVEFYEDVTSAYDGILGLGFARSYPWFPSSGAISPFQNFINQGFIQSPVFSFWHNP